MTAEDSDDREGTIEGLVGGLVLSSVSLVLLPPRTVFDRDRVKMVGLASHRLLQNERVTGSWVSGSRDR